jgi:hypothetical protein
LEDVVAMEGWTIRHDYLLCKAVLCYGVGNWETICQSRGDWGESGQSLTLRQYLCDSCGFKLISLSYFS